MFDDLLLHKQTLKRLEDIAENPSQGYLFLGPSGSGKRLAADRLAKHWSKHNVGYAITIEPAETSISIEQIHNLLPLLAQRVPADTRRVVIVDQAARLTIEAQNCLLKALEEPVERTTFLLLADDPLSLLPTVRSRLREVGFESIDQSQLVDWTKQKFGLSEVDATRNYHIGGSTPGGITRVTTDAGQAISLLETARNFLQSNSYERVKIISTLQGRERQEIREFITYLAKLISSALNNLKSGTETETYLLFGQKLNNVLDSINALDKYANPRIILNRLVLEL